jgi:hypothetical protein
LEQNLPGGAIRSSVLQLIFRERHTSDAWDKTFQCDLFFSPEPATFNPTQLSECKSLAQNNFLRMRRACRSL